jgi:hypothetical protein
MDKIQILKDLATHYGNMAGTKNDEELATTYAMKKQGVLQAIKILEDDSEAQWWQEALKK